MKSIKYPISFAMASILCAPAAFAQPAAADTADTDIADTDTAEPIITDEEFDETIPPIKEDLDAPLGSIEDWTAQQQKLQQLEQLERQEKASQNPDLVAAQDGDAIEAISDAPINDPEIDEPLVPLDDFKVFAFDESQFTEADDSADRAEFRYEFRIDGLEGLDAKSDVRPIDADDIIDRFRALSALEDGDGKATNGAMVSARMQEDQQLLVDIMAGQAYFDATVNGSVERPSEEGEDVTVVLTVTPGPRYVFDSIKFAAQPASPNDLLTRNFLPKISEPIVAERVLAAEANLAVVLPENGFPFVEVGQRDILIDPDTGGADYTLPIDTGPLSSFGDIITNGTTAFDAKHIDTISRFEKGELYDSRKIDDLRRALVATGLFSIVSVKPTQSGETGPDGREYATINVEQQAGPPRTISGSLGFATGQGLLLEGSWAHRNLFPPEGALIANALAGTQEQGASLTFRRSNAGRRDRTVEFGISAQRSDFDAFEAFTGRIAGRVSYESTPIWQKRLTYSYGFEILATNEESFNFNSGLRENNTFYVAALPAQVTFDTTDSLLDPTEGFRLSARVSPETSLGSGSQFYARNQIEGTAYYGAGENIVLAGRLRVGSIAGAARELIAPSRRLYAGGGGSVRGFGFQDLGPQDSNNDPIGGRSLVEAAAEVRYRFGDYGVVGFVDAGQVYTSSTPGFNDLRYGVGIGGRFYTNFGPLRLDVATPINRQPGESLVAVYISIGQAF